MAVRYTEEQLNTVDKFLLIQLFLDQQEQLQTLTAKVRSLNEKMQLMMEQMEQSSSSMRPRLSVIWMLRNRNSWKTPPLGLAGRASYRCPR